MLGRSHSRIRQGDHSSILGRCSASSVRSISRRARPICGARARSGCIAPPTRTAAVCTAAPALDGQPIPGRLSTVGVYMAHEHAGVIRQLTAKKRQSRSARGSPVSVGSTACTGPSREFASTGRMDRLKRCLNANSRSGRAPRSAYRCRLRTCVQMTKAKFVEAVEWQTTATTHGCVVLFP
jgi:hypothetical protein